MRPLRVAEEVPFHSQICVTLTGRILYYRGSINRKIRSVDVQLEVVRQAAVEFEIGCILAEVRVLRRLQSIKFIEELKVKPSRFGDCRIVRVEGQLRPQ